MQEHIITIYCLCDDFLRAWGHRDDPQAQMSDAEVMTVALVAAAFFVGNQRLSAVFLREHGYMKRVPSPGRLNRRLHAIPEATWQALFALLGRVHRQANAGQECAADSLPVPAPPRRYPSRPAPPAIKPPEAARSGPPRPAVRLPRQSAPGGRRFAPRKQGGLDALLHLALDTEEGFFHCLDKGVHSRETGDSPRR